MSADDDDQWTHVGPGKKSNRIRSPLPDRRELDPEMSIARLNQNFASRLKTWQQSSCSQQYYKRLDQNRPDEGWPIEKAICFASGSFSLENAERQRRSMQQLVAFIDTVNHIQNDISQPIQMFAQDPKYTDMDKAFLTEHGVTPLNIPRTQMFDLGPGLEVLGPHTAVFEFFMDGGFKKLRGFLNAGVPLFACGTWTRWLDGKEWMPADPETDREYPGKKRYFGDEKEDKALADWFHAHYRPLDLPVFEEDPNTFRKMAAHVKEAVEEDGE